MAANGIVMALWWRNWNASKVVSNVEISDGAEETANAIWNVSNGNYIVETNAINVMAGTENWNVSNFSFNVRLKERSARFVNVIWKDFTVRSNNDFYNGGVLYANGAWNDSNHQNQVITRVAVTPFGNGMLKAIPSPQMTSAITSSVSNFAYSVGGLYRFPTTPKHRLGETYAGFLELFSFRLITTKFCDRTMTIPPRGCVKAGGFRSC